MSAIVEELCGGVEVACLKCGRDMAPVRTESGGPLAVLRRVECSAGHTGTVAIRHDGSSAAETGTLYHGAAAPGGVAE